MKKISFNDYIPEELADTESCRLITTEQYQEYLKLKEEHKPLSWQELKEEAKKMGYNDVIKHPQDKDVIALIHKDLLYGFYPDGTVETDCFIEDDLCGMPIAYDRTPDQMLAIMKALQ